jgi:hypothetical protein
MVFATVDEIARRWLLDNGLPIHYYFEGVLHCASGIRELTKHSMKSIKTVRLPVNDYKAVDLPGDFKDDLGVAIPAGGNMQPVPKNDAINPMRMNDSTGAFTNYTDAADDDGEDAFYWGNMGWYWYWNVTDYGESQGKFFGAGGGSSANGYKVVKGRRQIQLTQTFTSDEIILMYVSSGQSADNATQVEFDAFRCLQTWIDWQSSPNKNFKDAPEARTFWNELRLFRAVNDDLTITDLKQILRKNFTAAIKN